MKGKTVALVALFIAAAFAHQADAYDGKGDVPSAASAVSSTVGEANHIGNGSRADSAYASQPASAVAESTDGEGSYSHETGSTQASAGEQSTEDRIAKEESSNEGSAAKEEDSDEENAPKEESSEGIFRKDDTDVDADGDGDDWRYGDRPDEQRHGRVPHHRKHDGFRRFPGRKERKRHFSRKEYLQRKHGLKHHRFDRSFPPEADEQRAEFLFENADAKGFGKHFKRRLGLMRKHFAEDIDDNGKRHFDVERGPRRKHFAEDIDDNGKRHFDVERGPRRKHFVGDQRKGPESAIAEKGVRGKVPTENPFEHGNERRLGRRMANPSQKRSNSHHSARPGRDSARATAREHAPVAPRTERNTRSFFGVLRNLF